MDWDIKTRTIWENLCSSSCSVTRLLIRLTTASPALASHFSSTFMARISRYCFAGNTLMLLSGFVYQFPHRKQLDLFATFQQPLVHLGQTFLAQTSPPHRQFMNIWGESNIFGHLGDRLDRLCQGNGNQHWLENVSHPVPARAHLQISEFQMDLCKYVHGHWSGSSTGVGEPD